MSQDFSTNPPPPHIWKDDEKRPVSLDEIKSRRVDMGKIYARLKKDDLSDLQPETAEFLREFRDE